MRHHLGVVTSSRAPDLEMPRNKTKKQERRKHGHLLCIADSENPKCPEEGVPKDRKADQRPGERGEESMAANGYGVPRRGDGDVPTPGGKRGGPTLWVCCFTVKHSL